MAAAICGPVERRLDLAVAGVERHLFAHRLRRHDIEGTKARRRCQLESKSAGDHAPMGRGRGKPEPREHCKGGEGADERKRATKSHHAYFAAVRQSRVITAWTSLHGRRAR